MDKIFTVVAVLAYLFGNREVYSKWENLKLLGDLLVMVVSATWAENKDEK